MILQQDDVCLDADYFNFSLASDCIIFGDTHAPGFQSSDFLNLASFIHSPSLQVGHTSVTNVELLIQKIYVNGRGQGRESLTGTYLISLMQL